MLITDPQALASMFDWFVTTVDVQASQTPLTGADFTRVYIGFVVSQTAGDMWVSPRPIRQAGIGFHINGSPNEQLEFHYARHGSMVGGEWWGIAVGPATIVSVCQVVYRPRLIVPQHYNGGDQ